MRLEPNVPLSRLTTIGTGGPARLFARPRTLAELEQVLKQAEADGIGIAVVGLGSNLLAADDGVGSLVLKLEGELAGTEVRDGLLVAGGGTPNAVALHRARAAGLGGFEFACAIPGTAGGGVKMNAGAYGSDWSSIVTRVLVARAAGCDWLSGEELGLEYRRSGLRPGEVVAAVEFRLTPTPRDRIKELVAELHARRKATQPTNRRTFGSVFKNPEHEHGAGKLLELCGLKGHRIGGARISPMHANFIENAGDATSSDAMALMTEARRRALEAYGVVLEHEVQLLGPLELPPL
jgi:UDP-N-acetylmuramate dehydrogenase